MLHNWIHCSMNTHCRAYTSQNPQVFWTWPEYIRMTVGPLIKCLTHMKR